MEGKETLLKSFLKFDKVATTLGFIVDTITILSILLALKLPEVTGIILPFFITPVLALAIWFLGAYVYLSYLHEYWERQQAENKFSERFLLFILNDLIVKFRLPKHLLPGIILFILVIFILSDKYFGGAIYFFISILIFAVLAIASFWKVISPNTNDDYYFSIRKKIDDEWDYVKERIGIELEHYYWISTDNLTEIAELWEIPTGFLRYALIKYANEFPRETKFASVYSRETNNPINPATGKVLIDIVKFPKDRFYYSNL